MEGSTNIVMLLRCLFWFAPSHLSVWIAWIHRPHCLSFHLTMKHYYILCEPIVFGIR